jgi:hypothetical protein
VAQKILAEMDRPSGTGDCDKPIMIDPEGQKVFGANCKKR